MSEQRPETFVTRALRAYEQERQQQFATGVDAIPIDVTDLRRAMNLIAREDIRFVPVIACAFADEELAAMFKQFLPDDIPGGKKSMLGRFGPISTLFARIQFAFAFDMMHSDILIALDKLRGHRNNIAHTWDQDSLRDFEADAIPLMGEIEHAMLHVDIKDGGDGDLSPEASFRLRTVWLLAKLFYERRFYTLAIRAKMKPYSALYSDGHPEALRKISEPAHLYTQMIFSRDRGLS
ncbi:hypothetical protein ABH994_003424 [Bradyrhizobium yuanmingense]|uniref:hypothetical protein n=1 Tax=Bradyrhizobium yuanmingense TaxID=108015 RepID=UPI0035159538